MRSYREIADLWQGHVQRLLLAAQASDPHRPRPNQAWARWMSLSGIDHLWLEPQAKRHIQGI